MTHQNVQNININIIINTNTTMSTNKNMNNIRFATENNLMSYSPKQKFDSFYQICIYKDLETGLYNTKKIVFDENENIVRITPKQRSLKILKKFMTEKNVHKYKLFPVVNLDNVALPTGADIAQARSYLINNSTQHYGYEKWS